MQDLTHLSIDTKRLHIRPVQYADLQQIFHIHRNAKVNQYLPYETWQERDQANVWFEQVQERRIAGTSEQFVIEQLDSSQNNIIGTCLVFVMRGQVGAESECTHFGYVLAESSWKQGFMLEAMLAFVPALQDKLSLQSLFATVETANQPSIRLLEKLGFTMIETQIEEDQTEVYLFEKAFSSDL